MAQTKNVNMTPNDTLPRLHLSQYDVGRELSFSLCDGAVTYSVPTGATVKLMGTKPSGFGFVETCTVSGSTASISTTSDMTDEWGAVACELVVEKSGVRLGSTNLLLVVEKSPHPEGTTDGSQETVIPTLTLLVERVEAAASSILDMTVEAETLAAGSDATYSYDEETNTATFGIPRGADGSLASGVLAPTYSTSGTYAVGDYVYYSGNLYRCTTAITTAESWTSGHWTQVALAPEVSDLKSAITNTNIMNTNLFANATWVTGEINPTTGGDASSATKLRTNYIDISSVDNFQTSVATGYKYAGYLINADKTAVVHIISWTTGIINIDTEDYPTAKYVRFVLQKTDNTLPDSESYLTGKYSTILMDNINNKMTTKNVEIDLTSNSLISGSLQASTMTVSANQACVSYLTKIPVNGGENVKIEPPTITGVDHYTYRFGFYDVDGTYINQIATTTNPICTALANARFISFMVVAYDSNNSQVSFNVLNAFTNDDMIKVVYLDRYVTADGFATMAWCNEHFEPTGDAGYMIDVANIKHGVKSSRIGELKYPQAFCIWDNKYYSIDGDNIAEQNASMTVLRDVALSTGHGNSLQLGSNGKAYASGWNDSHIYVIDLATLTIDEIITIPVNQYFSAVVDDVNNIAYILHRDDYPDTVANYTLTVYDITNDTVISSKTVNAFGALQSMDFVDGKIIAGWGLGSVTVPDGIAIYNTNGDIIARFDLLIFNITELEGIAFNRTLGGGIYASLWNKSIYKIYI